MLSFMFYQTKNRSSYPGCCKKLDYFNCGNIRSYKENNDEAHGRCCMETLGIILKNLTHDDIFNALEIATAVLGETEVNDTTSIHLDNIVVFLYKPTDDFRGLTISASDNKVHMYEWW
ncbi:hypothetical protein GOODEAATRI_006399 [Goodea atripinnis]|uniref:Uncharacterized protein n=1 Tax=Goodea atripinnis TaxID=208336 RepID=A0ABV0MPT1_9TELE